MKQFEYVAPSGVRVVSCVEPVADIPRDNNVVLFLVWSWKFSARRVGRQYKAWMKELVNR